MDTSSRSRFAPKLVAIAGLTAAAIALAIVVIWATRPGESPVLAPRADSNNLRKTETFAPLKTEALLAPSGVVDQPQPNLQGSWEERLDNILTSEESNTESVRRLLKDFDRLPPEAQSEYMAHALNLSEDENFSAVESIYFRDGVTKEVQEQIFDEVLNRPDEIKLPLMARTMQAGQHPMREAAKEILVLYLEVDPQSEASINWSDRTSAYLKENAGEE